jgi:heme-degrading monooxygenase HmoA
MYVQVVTYGLGGIDENEYLDVANELAPRFSALPGLQAKIWLEDPDLGRYGAVYFWEDRESMERFLRSDLFEGTNPDFDAVDSEGFGILANLTAQTQPGLEVVPPPRRAVAAPRPQQALPKKATAKKATAKKATAKKAPAKAATAKKFPAKRVAKKTAG